MADPRIIVEAPARAERLGGLLPVAEVRDGVELLLASADLAYIPEPCELVYDEAGYCYSVFPGADKTFTGVTEGISVVPNFAGVYGVECFIAPGNEADFARRSREGLTASEGRRIEAKLYTWLLPAPPVPATDIVDAVAIAEYAADQNYIGRPVIHMHRGDAVRAGAADAIFGDGTGRLWTINGTPVIASSAYAVGALHITGAVTVLRSDIVQTTTPEIQQNDQFAMAERGYGLLVDCDFRVGVDFTTP